MSRWFRMYDELLDDPKVQRLPAEDFRGWVNLLCLASRNGGKLPPQADIAFALRETLDAVSTLVERLRSAGLIERRSGGADGAFDAPYRWNERQYKSDTSTDRVKRFRQRSRNCDETPPDTETETETEEEKPKPNGLVKKSVRGTRLPPDWEPEALTGKAAAMVVAWQPGAIERELAKFKNYWLAKGANAARTDWQRTWVNWLISADERTPRMTRDERSDPLLSALGKFQSLAGGVSGGPGTGKNPQTGGSNFDDGSGPPVVARIGGGRA